MTNHLLILERSSTELEFKQDNGVYILEGIFGEIDKKNKNNRIYTEAEYLPQIESLQAKIKSSKLLGELDHPANFDVSLKNVSHVIEELTYDKETKQVKGRIRLLDTDAGRQAKALVDAGVPLQISSRAAGAVESNGQVKIKQLFTYDLVADPGFENAELTRMNESFGYANDGDLLIYEINANENKITENKNENKMAESKFISTEDFNKYSQYLSEEIKSIKENLTSLTESESSSSKVESLREYTDYLAEKLDQSIAYTETIAESADKSIQYGEHLAEKLDQSIQYSEHIAEGVDQIKSYTNYLAESYNEGATTHESLLEYVEYLRGNLEKVTEYAEYVAETVNTNLLVEDEAGIDAEAIKAELKDVTVDIVDADGNVIDGEAEDIEKDLELKGEGDAAGEEIQEGEAGIDAEAIKAELKDVTVDIVDADGNVIDGEAEDIEKDLELKGEGDAAGEEIQEGEAGIDAEAIKAELKDVTVDTVDADGNVIDSEVEDIEKDLELKGEGDAEGEEIQEKSVEVEVEIEDEKDEEEEEDAYESYKSEISAKLQALIEQASVKVSPNPAFFKFISESSRSEFNALNENEKSTVAKAIEGKGYLTEGQIIGLWKNSLIGAVATESTPNVISMMPAEYQETWKKLSESKKNQIMAQSKMVRLETEYQVTNFWQTRDLRETASVMEKINMINESKVEDTTTGIGYDTSDIAAQIAARFKK